MPRLADVAKAMIERGQWTEVESEFFGTRGQLIASGSVELNAAWIATLDPNESDDTATPDAA